jgi:hypothetical protein
LIEVQIGSSSCDTNQWCENRQVIRQDENGSLRRDQPAVRVDERKERDAIKEVLRFTLECKISAALM